MPARNIPYPLPKSANADSSLGKGAEILSLPCAKGGGTAKP